MSEISRRSLLKASPAALAMLAVPAVATDQHPSRFTELIAAQQAAQARMDAVAVRLDQAQDAATTEGPILVPLGLLPNGTSPSGWLDLYLFSDHAIAEQISEECSQAKTRVCTAFTEALAPGRNAELAAGIDAMEQRSLSALNDAITLRAQRELDQDIPAISEEFWEADEALDELTIKVLGMVPVTAGEGLEKASWLRDYLRNSKGHMLVQEWDALIASIGGVSLPSIWEVAQK